MVLCFFSKQHIKVITVSIIVNTVIVLFVVSLCHGQYLPENHYKALIANHIGQKISAARGDLRLMPQIYLNPMGAKNNYIAQFRPKPRPVIIIDEKLYDICTGFGKDSLNALACIIGHELAHFYENHMWTESFTDMIGLAGRERLGLNDTDKGHLEAQADAFGVFYGFLAGYDTYRVLPNILDAIYKAYNIPDVQKGYPDKKERMGLSKEKIIQISPLLYIFKAGKLLLMRNEYDEAAVCFDHILNYFPAPEIYNNSGLTRLVKAIEFIDSKQVYFAYPFELDAESRLKKGATRYGQPGGNLIKAEDLLSHAKEALEKAILLDKYYSSAYVNLSCTYSLLGNQAAAIGKINELEGLLSKGNLPGNAHLIRGIAFVKDGQYAKAKSDFEQAVKKRAFQSEYNFQLYLELREDWFDKSLKWLAEWPKLQHWIDSFWMHKNRTKKTSASFYETLSQQTILGAEFEKVTPIIIHHSSTVITLKVITDDVEQKLQMKLELPDYSISAIFLKADTLNLNKDDKLDPQKNGFMVELEPDYSLSGVGLLHYDFYRKDNLIFEMSGTQVKGIWKCNITF